MRPKTLTNRASKLTNRASKQSQQAHQQSQLRQLAVQGEQVSQEKSNGSPAPLGEWQADPGDLRRIGERVESSKAEEQESKVNEVATPSARHACCHSPPLGRVDEQALREKESLWATCESFRPRCSEESDLPDGFLRLVSRVFVIRFLPKSCVKSEIGSVCEY